jgi:hypothetical protein
MSEATDIVNRDRRAAAVLWIEDSVVSGPQDRASLVAGLFLPRGAYARRQLTGGARPRRQKLSPRQRAAGTRQSCLAPERGNF